MFQSWFFKILWWLTFMAIALVVIVTINHEWIVKELVERQIRVATRFEPEIGDVSSGVLVPNVTFGNFRLYNTAAFGGTPFLDMPELHIEYDRAALRRHEIHIRFMRVNVREMDVVKNESGATNIMSIADMLAPRKSGGGRMVASLNGYKFTGIDLLNLSIGVVKFVDLNDQRRNRRATIGLENLIYTNVVSPANLPGLSGQLWLRGAFMVGLPVSPPTHNASP